VALSGVPSRERQGQPPQPGEPPRAAKRKLLQRLKRAAPGENLRRADPNVCCWCSLSAVPGQWAGGRSSGCPPARGGGSPAPLQNPGATPAAGQAPCGPGRRWLCCLAGPQQWRALARQAVLWGKRVAVLQPAAYGGYAERAAIIMYDGTLPHAATGRLAWMTICGLVLEAQALLHQFPGRTARIIAPGPVLQEPCERF